MNLSSNEEIDHIIDRPSISQERIQPSTKWKDVIIADINDDPSICQERIQISTEWKDVIVLKLIVITSVMFSLFFSECLTESRSYPVSSTAMNVSILLITLLSLISMVVMFCLKNKIGHFTSKQHFESYGRPLIKRATAINFKNVVSAVFMIGTLCYQILNLIYCFYCSRGDYAIELSSYFVLILFCIVQQYFIIKFKGLECNSSLARCSVTFVLEVNIIMCLRVLVRETFDLWREITTGTDENRTQSDKNEYDLNPLNDMCFNQSSSNLLVSKVISSVSPNLYPIVIEYSVIAIQNLFAILALSSNKHMELSEQDMLSKRQSNERTPLLKKGGFKISPSTHGTVSRWMCKCRCSFFVGFLVGIPFAAILFSTLYTTNSVVESINDVVYTIFTFSLLLSCVIGLVLALRERDQIYVKQVASFGASDIIYFIAVSSTSLFHSFSLIASFTLLNSPIPTPKTSLYFRLLHEIFMFLTLLFQTMFIRKCKTLSLNSVKTKSILIKQALIFVSVCNTVLWFVNSFYPFYKLANPNHAGTTDVEFYGVQAWALVFKITVPLAIYYRFQSVLLCIELFAK